MSADSNTTGIKEVSAVQQRPVDNAWYDLSGRRLTDKPTYRGIYIHNGIKVVIK